MIDPVTAFAAANAAFKGVKMLVGAGREIQDVSKQLGTWYGAVADITRAESQRKNPTWLDKKTHVTENIEKEAMDIIVRKKTLIEKEKEFEIIKFFQDELLNNLVLRGIKNISAVIPRKITDSVEEDNGTYNRKEIWVLDTIGTNLLGLLSLDNIDVNNTFTNDIQEVYRILGVEAARQIIYNELAEVIEFDGTYINYHNFSLLCDRMTFTSKLISITRFGVNSDNIGPIAKASFEETPEMFLNAARYAEMDNMRGISANVMCGQEGYFGTSCFQVFIDIEEMKKLQEASKYEYIDEDEEIEKFFDEKEDTDDACSLLNLQMQNMVINIHPENIGNVNTDYNPGF